jgi:transposase InsO family protein
VTVSQLCRAAGLSRQGYYKGRRERRRRQVDEEALVELVKRERAVQPRLGGRKLRVVLKREMEEMGIRVGRDRFFGILRGAGLLLERRRRRARTTDSRHSFRTYGNLYREACITGAHQAWVSDLTYVRTDEGFVYVSLISDAYSRKIVGHAAQRTLEASGSVRALGMALGQLPAGARPLHHSDRGVQYCCWDYVEMLESRGLGISMTEELHCYENAQAERLNGILKAEYGLGESFRTRAQASAALGQAVRLYNERRPHTALGYRTPQQVHEEGRQVAA